MTRTEVNSDRYETLLDAMLDIKRLAESDDLGYDLGTLLGMIADRAVAAVAGAVRS